MKYLVMNANFLQIGQHKQNSSLIHSLHLASCVSSPAFKSKLHKTDSRSTFTSSAPFTSCPTPFHHSAHQEFGPRSPVNSLPSINLLSELTSDATPGNTGTFFVKGSFLEFRDSSLLLLFLSDLSCFVTLSLLSFHHQNFKFPRLQSLALF